MAEEPHATPKRRSRAIKAAAIAIGALAALAILVLVGANLFVRVAYEPFYERAQAVFPLPGLSEGFVPQDLDYLDEADAWLFSGYTAAGGPSPLYRRSSEGAVARLAVEMPDGTPYDDHGSAVTSEGGYVLLSCEGGYLALSASAVAAAEDGGTVRAEGSVSLGFSPAFMNVEEGTLYAGEFYFPSDYETPAHHHVTTADGTENPAIMYAYPPSAEGSFGFAEQPDRAYSIPAKVQGVAITPGGRLVLSTSYGLSSSQLLAYDLSRAELEGTFADAGAEVPLYALDGRCLAEAVEAPPMTEGIESHEGLVYVAEESASSKYLFGRLYGAGTVYALAL